MIRSSDNQFNKGNFGTGREAPISLGITHTIKLRQEDGTLGPGRSLRPDDSPPKHIDSDGTPYFHRLS